MDNAKSRGYLLAHPAFKHGGVIAKYEMYS
jgi:hypothetical protein